MPRRSGPAPARRARPAAPSGGKGRRTAGPGRSAGARSRPSTREGRTQRRASSADDEQADRPRSSRLTSRAAILGLVVCAVVLTLAYPTRTYLAQRGQISQLQAQNQEKQQRVDALTQQQARWNDPDYVRAQARQRLQYVMPGQILYVVVDPSTTKTPTKRATTVTPSRDASDTPWYSQLWGTAQAADSAK